MRLSDGCFTAAAAGRGPQKNRSSRNHFTLGQAAASHQAVPKNMSWSSRKDSKRSATGPDTPHLPHGGRAPSFNNPGGGFNSQHTQMRRRSTRRRSRIEELGAIPAERPRYWRVSERAFKRWKWAMRRTVMLIRFRPKDMARQVCPPRPPPATPAVPLTLPHSDRPHPHRLRSA